MDLKEIVCEGVYWIQLTQKMVQRLCKQDNEQSSMKAEFLEELNKYHHCMMEMVMLMIEITEECNPVLAPMRILRHRNRQFISISL
jgi:hypothetical protein